MSFDHNLKLVSFRIMVDVNAELSVDGVIEVSSMLLCFGFCGMWGFCVWVSVEFEICLDFGI